MKKGKGYLILTISCLFFFSFCFKESRTCADLRNGKYYYFAKRSRERIEVYRQDSLQLETGSKKDDIPSKSKIVWKNDCEYDMFINGLSDTQLTGDDSIIAITPAHVKIVHIEKSFYICVAKLNLFDRNVELRDTLYFIK